MVTRPAPGGYCITVPGVDAQTTGVVVSIGVEQASDAAPPFTRTGGPGTGCPSTAHGLRVRWDERCAMRTFHPTSSGEGVGWDEKGVGRCPLAAAPLDRGGAA